MPYPDDLLSDDERVMIHKHPHWKMLVLPVLAFLLIAAVCGYAAALIAGQTWQFSGYVTLAVVAVGGAVWLTLVPLLRWRTTHFVLTTHRVLVREGVLSRSGIDIPIRRINSVQFRHTLVERMLGCGTLTIESASEEPLEFDDIPQVERVHSLLNHDLHRGGAAGTDRADRL